MKANVNKNLCSVMKTLLPKENNLRPVITLHRDERFLSLAQTDKLHHEFKWILQKHAHRAFYWLKYACIYVSDV